MDKHYPTVIASTTVLSHFFAFIILMVSSTPKFAYSFVEAHGALGIMAAVVGYLVFFMNEHGQARLFGVALTLGAWLALIAPDMEHMLFGAVGLLLYGIGIWTTVLLRKHEAKNKRY